MRRGLRLVCGGVRLIYISNEYHHARFGLAVSRKYGNAVQRNRLKRQWRDCFRNSGIRRFSVDILAVPVRSQAQMTHPINDMQQAFKQLARKLEAVS